jgi:putative endonuclease
MFSVYVLRSGKTGRLYVGSCADLADRLRRHNAGESPATKHGLPWTLIYEEQLSTRAMACTRERYFKTGRGRDELNRLYGERAVAAATDPATAGKLRFESCHPD